MTDPARLQGILSSVIDQDNIADIMRALLVDVLGVDRDQANMMDHQTQLFGALPELDSMAVAGLLTEMEDRLDIIIDDEDVDGELFETFGSLVEFTEMKLAAKA